jgi:hypothetical protein
MRNQNLWNAQFPIYLFTLPSKTQTMFQAMNQLIHPPTNPIHHHRSYVHIHLHWQPSTQLPIRYTPPAATALFLFIHLTSHKHIYISLIIKPNRCANFSNLFLEWNSTCFGQFLCPLSGVFHWTHNNGVCHTGLLTACQQDQDGSSILITLARCQKTCMTYTMDMCSVKNFL